MFTAAAFSPGCSHLAVGCSDGSLGTFDVAEEVARAGRGGEAHSDVSGASRAWRPEGVQEGDAVEQLAWVGGAEGASALLVACFASGLVWAGREVAAGGM